MAEAAGPAARSASAGTPAATVQVTQQGYLLRQCRVGGDKKAFKRRFMVLQGGTLYYFHAHSLAGQPRLLTHLPTGAQVAAAAATDDGRYPHALRIEPVIGGTVHWLSAASNDEQHAWLEPLERAVGQPQREFADPGSAAAGSSMGFRFKLSLGSALASSLLGRKMIKHYLEPAGRQIIEGWLLSVFCPFFCLSLCLSLSFF